MRPTAKAFEKKLCEQLTDRLGAHITPHDLLAWDVSKVWLESIKDDNEEIIFLPGIEVWVLVRSRSRNVKQPGSQTFNNTGSERKAA